MEWLHRIRSHIVGGIALTALAALLWAAPTFIRTPTASAQGYGSCPAGTYPIPTGTGGYYCGTSTTPGSSYCYPPYGSPTYCSSPSSGVAVTYSPGWNLVGGPAGTTIYGAAGPLYGWPAGATSYQALPPGTSLQSGAGYWAYFTTSTTIYLPYVASSSTTVQLLPAQFALIGNPGNTTATVSGAGVVLFTYSPSTGSYTQTNQFNPGQGAWALSLTGGTVTIANAPSPFGPPPPPF